MASNNKVALHIQHIHLGDSTFRNESRETQAADSGKDTYQEVLTHRKGINQDTCQIVVTMSDKKGGVAHLLNCRDDCLAFWLIVPPLLIVPSLACSVASLSLCPEP